MSVNEERLREVDVLVSRARRLGDSNGEVQAGIVIGSYAYGRPRMDSDVDIVFAVANRDRWLQEDAWVGQVVGAPFHLLREQDWGPLRERRFQTASGLEVEFGLVTSEWFATPVDPGTAKVLSDGCLILSDKEGLASGALGWLTLPAKGWTTAGATHTAEPPARS